MRTERISWEWVLLIPFWLFAASDGANAAPLDLSDETSRWVEVRFEISPEEAPGQLDRRWSEPRRALLEVAADRQTVRIRIPSGEVEAQLRSTGEDPVSGSFSEFVWVLDPKTGHVLEAGTEGRVRSVLKLGLLRSRTEITVRVEMTTRVPAGFMASRTVLGNRMHGFCTGLDRPHQCTLVQPRPYDPERGYVNAVGFLSAESRMAKIRTFSPLGEVVFRELTDKEGTSILSGPIPHDAVCSGVVSGSCGPILRGESS